MNLPATSDSELANALRALAMDAVETAKSGHPGMPMGMAEIAVALWGRHLKHNPGNPAWANRDRFVLSNGHGSMLLYALLHLTGYDLPMAELKRFRQLGSKTPGHPEVGHTPGVETTTGPLGQGVANAVGMALAEKLLAAHFNRPGLDIVDHHTYVFLGDGCMMEGISHEACSLAGTLGLGKLIAVYDDNGISIDSDKGHIAHWYTDDVPKRFAGYGWQVIAAVDGHDVGAVDAIVDVTGSCIGLHLLGIDAVHFGALPVGGGFIDGPHGRIPVPGPATAELLKGFPTLDTGIRRELVTPTGAAILTTLAAGAGAMPAMRVTAVGYGAGTMDLDTPNVLRLFVGEAPLATVTTPAETIVQVETTVDDMSPQLYEPLLERLLEAGALDAWLTPVIMKRSRPGVVLTALCEPGRVADLSRLLFEESSTIGVRWTAYQRAPLEREMVTLATAYGPVAFKVSRLEGRVVTVTPEFEEIRRIAKEKGLAVREVLDQARADGRRLLGGE